MNEGDIEFYEASTNATRDGARFLWAFVGLINSISDGWAHWTHGRKCSTELQELLQAPDTATAAKISAAKKKVLIFLVRCKQTKNDPTVAEFIKRWRT
jgi:hypothetical protein